jgi:hypothetical protein
MAGTGRHWPASLGGRAAQALDNPKEREKTGYVPPDERQAFRACEYRPCSAPPPTWKPDAVTAWSVCGKWLWGRTWPCGERDMFMLILEQVRKKFEFIYAGHAKHFFCGAGKQWVWRKQRRLGLAMISLSGCIDNEGCKMVPDRAAASS